MLFHLHRSGKNGTGGGIRTHTVLVLSQPPPAFGLLPHVVSGAQGGI